MTSPAISPSQNKTSILQLFRSITLQEWITAAVIAAALGVAYWAWTLVYDFTKPFLKPLGLKYLTSGLWILASVFLSDLIRKPSIALFASIIAAFVEALITQWGMSAVIYGVVQGVGAELVFLIFAYKVWNLSVLSLAAAVSAFFSYSYDYLINQYSSLSIGLNFIQVMSFMISAVVLGAFLSRYLSNRLLKTGLLDNFLIAKQAN
ncbi:ECF transporter S component [Hydromonas duriensis]|uniref:Energy-coupling factor transport system substrate-specific component n=1 Tax=Hydromonas duriensis TaxID=1527608 RepID=A0A4R6YB50_9BURK|nr:ECF transporter S component [Hydromonas duriensis]TDR32841.1 energy-coupling factor transport system substrate-specific component [Hydromonas duriensis]